MAILLYQTTIKGRMILRGNSLGISDAGAQCCRQWALISLDPTQSAGSGFPSSTSTTLPGSPFGTTLDWTKNGSFSQIDIAPSESVDHAVLLWAMTNTASAALANTPITFNTPVTTTIISPNPSYSINGTDGFQSYYTRAADVTNLVQNGGAGIYSISAVPAPASAISNVGTGWLLAITFKDDTQPVRNMSMFAESASNWPSNLFINISGFQAPSTGPVNALAYVSAQWGDHLGTEAFTVNGVNLSGSKNPASNFFQGQVVDENGTYYNSSMNSYNVTVGNPGTITPFARQEFDITTVNATGAVLPNATSAQIGVPFSNTDAVNVTFLGLQLDALLATIDMTKTADKNYAGGGSTLTYTVAFTNSGNTTAQNIFFKDTIPTGTTFIPNSVAVNGTTISGANPNPPSSVPISDMGQNITSTVTFQVLVNTTIPVPSTIYNSAIMTYTGLGTTTPLSSLSNEAITTVSYQAIIDNASGGMTKTALPNAVKLGETITYTIALTNTGNTTANNVFFTDTLPTGTSLAIGSSNPNPPSSISVGSIGPNATSTVTFQVIVNTLPSGGTIPNTGSVNFTFTQDPSIPNGVNGSGNSNTVVSYANDAVLSSNKSASSSYATLGDTLTYTVVISNSGNSTANNVIFIDTIPSSTTFVLGSLVQDGTTIPSSSNPPGASLSNIAPNTTSTVTFNVYVYTLPASNPILNTATTNFNFVLDPSTTPNIISNGSSLSNSASTTISLASLGNMSKSVDKSYAICGDTLTYTITLPNSGNVTAINVVLYDTIPNNTSLIPDSVTVNGATQNGYNPTLGITIPNISPSTNATITFKVVVVC